MNKAGAIISTFYDVDEGDIHSWEDVPEDMVISFKCNSCGREMGIRKKDIPVSLTCHGCGKEIEIHIAKKVVTV